MTEEAMWTLVTAGFPKESFPRGGGSGLVRTVSSQGKGLSSQEGSWRSSVASGSSLRTLVT